MKRKLDIPDPELERYCGLCSGDGQHKGPMDVDWRTCPHCGGTGKVVTEFGAAVLEFVTRRMAATPPPRGQGE